MKWFCKLLDWIMLPIKYQIALLLVFAIPVFAPSEILNKIGILNIVNKYFEIIVIIFIAVLILLIVNLGELLLNKILTEKSIQKGRVESIAKLHKLTMNEKLLLFTYIYKKVKSLKFPPNDGVVLELQRKKFIYNQSIFHTFMDTPFAISEWVWEYLNNNYDSIFSEQEKGLFTAIITGDKVELAKYLDLDNYDVPEKINPNYFFKSSKDL